MKRIHTVIDIAAPPAQVWEHLTDFTTYPEWSPFVRSVGGSPEEGFRFRVAPQPPGKKRASTFKPTVTVAEPHRGFEWLGSLGIKRIFDDCHRFDLTPTDTGTRFEQSETFAGILAGPSCA